MDDICQFAADDLVFIDKSIFNKKTSWHQHAYALIGNTAIIDADILYRKT
jgi:hypothetical protein